MYFCSMSWRTNRQKDHRTTIQKKQQITSKLSTCCYNPLSVTSVVSTVINVYLHGRLFCTLYPSSSPNWTAHISPTWTHKLYSTQYQTNPVPLFLHILIKQQTKCSNVFSVTVYQQALKLHPKCAYKKAYHVLIKRDNELSPDYLATFKTHTTTCRK